MSEVISGMTAFHLIARERPLLCRIRHGILEFVTAKPSKLNEKEKNNYEVDVYFTHFFIR